VRLPSSLPLCDLPAWARAHAVQYLVYSPIERVQSPAFAVLADSGLALPGIRPLAWRSLGPDRFYALYRLEAPPADSAAFAAAYHAAVLRYERRRPDSPEAALFVAGQLLDLAAPDEALARLDRLERAGAHDPAVERLRVGALLALGRPDEAAAACRAAMRLEPPSGWHWATLGSIRWRQHRLDEARRCYQNAVECEPATITYLESLGRVEIEQGDYVGAAAEFERCLVLAPTDVRLRRFAMGAWQLAGRPERVRRLYADGLNAGLAPAALMTGQ